MNSTLDYYFREIERLSANYGKSLCVDRGCLLICSLCVEILGELQKINARIDEVDK